MPFSASSFTLSLFLSSHSLEPSTVSPLTRSSSLPSGVSAFYSLSPLCIATSALLQGQKWLVAWKDDRDGPEREYTGTLSCQEGGQQQGGQREGGIVGACEFRVGDKAYPTLEGEVKTRCSSFRLTLVIHDGPISAPPSPPVAVFALTCSAESPTSPLSTIPQFSPQHPPHIQPLNSLVKSDSPLYPPILPLEHSSPQQYHQRYHPYAYSHTGSSGSRQPSSPEEQYKPHQHHQQLRSRSHHQQQQRQQEYGQQEEQEREQSSGGKPAMVEISSNEYLELANAREEIKVLKAALHRNLARLPLPDRIVALSDNLLTAPLTPQERLDVARDRDGLQRELEGESRAGAKRELGGLLEAILEGGR